MECWADMPGNATVDMFQLFVTCFFFIFILHFYDF